jgi:hypothetical protein
MQLPHRFEYSLDICTVVTQLLSVPYVHTELMNEGNDRMVG